MSPRQLFFMILLTVPVYKIAMLPSFMANISGQDMWFSVGNSMLFDLLLLAGILLIKSRVGKLQFQNKGFKIATSVVAVLCCAYFLLQFTVFSEETLGYLLQAFFDDGDRLQIAVPLVVAAAYLGYKGCKTLGRVCEVFVWFFAFAVVMSVIFNNAEIDYSNLKPVLDGDIGQKAFGGMRGYLWFGDYLPLLFIDLQDRKKKKPLLVLGGGLGVTLFTSALFAVFFAQWGDLTSSVPNAFARLSGYNIISADVGKVDWISILSWLSCGVLKLATLLVGVSGAIRYVFGEKADKYSAPVGGAIGLILLAFFIKDIRIAYSVGQVVGVYGAIFGGVVVGLILLFSILQKKTVGESVYYE